MGVFEKSLLAVFVQAYIAPIIAGLFFDFWVIVYIVPFISSLILVIYALYFVKHVDSGIETRLSTNLEFEEGIEVEINSYLTSLIRGLEMFFISGYSLTLITASLGSVLVYFGVVTQALIVSEPLTSLLISPCIYFLSFLILIIILNPLILKTPNNLYVMDGCIFFHEWGHVRVIDVDDIDKVTTGHFVVSVPSDDETYRFVSYNPEKLKDAFVIEKI